MYDYIRMRIQAMTKSERGASAVEYGLLVSLIAVAIILGATLLGNNLDTLFTDTASKL